MRLLPLYRKRKEVLTRELISQCLKDSARAQRHLFELYYSDGMNIALRYSSNEADAKEILSNAYLRVFRKLSNYDKSRPFLPWFRKIIIHASSDFYRYAHEQPISLERLPEPGYSDDAIDKLYYQELLMLIQMLSLPLRQVFNLYVIEGYKHREIAELLQISEGTSKSYLHRAKATLQLMILEFSKRQGIGRVQQEDKKKASQRS